MHDAKVAWKIREQLREFSGKVSVGLPKTAARLVREVLYGVQSRASDLTVQTVSECIAPERPLSVE